MYVTSIGSIENCRSKAIGGEHVDAKRRIVAGVVIKSTVLLRSDFGSAYLKRRRK